jgi:hypothetical protein
MDRVRFMVIVRVRVRVGDRVKGRGCSPHIKLSSEGTS